MIAAAEGNDVAGLPLGRIVKVTGQHQSVGPEEPVQIADTAKVNVGIGSGNVIVSPGIGGNVGVHQILQLDGQAVGVRIGLGGLINGPDLGI